MKYFSEKDMHAIPELVELRGVIISKAITIEASIDKIIIHYFAGQDKEKYSIMHDAIVKDLGAAKKQEILKKVIRALPIPNPEVIIQRLSPALKGVFEVRNSMAHAQWSMVESEGVTFAKNKTAGNLLIGNNEVEVFNGQYNLVIAELTKIYFTYFFNFQKYKPVSSKDSEKFTASE